jgi:hypothetical protein
MSAKVTFDHGRRLVVPIGPPTGGEIEINVQVDIYSDGKEDWLADPTLNRFIFPVLAIGGQTISAGKLGTTYILRAGWHLKPFEGDHHFNIVGNLFTEDGSDLLVPTDGSFQVHITQQVSTLVEVVQAGSALTAEEQTQLEELHQIHGLELGQPMEVTPSARKVGDGSALKQTLTQDGTKVTVTRDA